MRFQNVSNELNVGYKQRDRKKEIYFLFFILRSSVLFLLEDHYWITANESEKKKMEKYDRISNMKSSSCTCVVRCDEDLTTFLFNVFFFVRLFFSWSIFFLFYLQCFDLNFNKSSVLFRFLWRIGRWFSFYWAVVVLKKLLFEWTKFGWQRSSRNYKTNHYYDE